MDPLSKLRVSGHFEGQDCRKVVFLDNQLMQYARVRVTCTIAGSLTVMNFPAYLYQLAETLAASEGPKLAYLLRPTSPHGKELVKQFRNTTVTPTANSCLWRNWFTKAKWLACVFCSLRREFGEPMGRNCHTLRAGLHAYREEATGRGLQGAV